MSLFSCPVMSDSLQCHGLQHAKPPCPSPFSGVCSSSCPLHQWCHPAISSSDALFFCPQFFPVSGTFPMSCLFISDDQNTGASASVSVLPVNIESWSPLRLIGLICLLYKGLSGVFSTRVRRHQFFGVLPTLQSISHILRDHCEDHSLDYMNLCRQSNVFAFQHTVYICHSFPAKKQLSSDFMTTVSVCSDFEPKKRKAVTTSTFSHSICHEVMGPDAMILVFFFF